MDYKLLLDAVRSYITTQENAELDDDAEHRENLALLDKLYALELQLIDLQEKA